MTTGTPESYDLVAQENGYCGHICPTEGPCYGYVCTRATGHDDHTGGEKTLHQVVQLIGPDEVLGHINAAWYEDGTVTLYDPVSPACPISGNDVSPQDLARIDQRVAVVSNMVDRMVDDYRYEGTHDSAMDVFRFNLKIFHGYSQAPTEDEALKGACEALAVAVKKLAEATAAQDQ